MPRLRNRSFTLAGLVWLLSSGLAVESGAGTSSLSSDEIAASVVKIIVVASAPNYDAPWQLKQPERFGGSGAIIAGNRILTNAHVVDNETLIEVQRVGSPRRYTARVEHQCDPCDLAILSVSDPEFFEGTQPLEIGELPRRQQSLEIYGFPEGGESLSITRGIVSRVEVEYYSHSWSQLLIAQVDAAINSGNSGGPTVSNGKIVGAAMQTLEDAENIGDIVPAPIIRHFLEDVRDGHFDGFPRLGLDLQQLENAVQREQLGLDDGSGGVLVTGVLHSSSANGRINPGDVILEIDHHPILQNNTVDLGRGLLVDSRFIVQQKQVGDQIEVKLRRAGRVHTVQIKLRAPDPLIELASGDRRPSYLIYGGLVFQPVTFRYLGEFDDIPPRLLAFWKASTLSDRALLGRNIAKTHRSEVVALTGVLASDLTRGYQSFEGEVVYAVNGTPVRNLEHLAKLLDDPANDLVEIAMQQGGRIALRRDQVNSESAEILARYQVSADRSPDLVVPAKLAE